jgi:DNA-binding NtrC family response regulator
MRMRQRLQHGQTRCRRPGRATATLAEVERRYAAQVLAESGGNKTRAAEVLGIDRKTLYRILGDGE